MRVIRSLPAARDQDRRQLIGMLRDMLDDCLSYQRANGLFYDEPDDPSTYVETDLASMLAYTIYESVRGGWLPQIYLPAADRMRAAVRAKVDRLGFVEGIAGAPRFDRPGVSTEGQAFFILMEAAARKAGRPALSPRRL
jgi:rhamnogalacturonyl hydrolase YesR